jgi:hypothetical protein
MAGHSMLIEGHCNNWSKGFILLFLVSLGINNHHQGRNFIKHGKSIEMDSQ